MAIVCKKLSLYDQFELWISCVYISMGIRKRNSLIIQLVPKFANWRSKTIRGRPDQVNREYQAQKSVRPVPGHPQQRPIDK